MSILVLNDLDYLLPRTREVLLQLSEYEWLDDYAFVGGSGLSLFLHHRLSEDIDLFTWKENIEKDKIIPALQKKYKDNLQIINDSQKQIDLQINKVKVTFFANNWEALKDHQLLTNHLHVANLDLLVGMKLNTLFLRAKFRDYYDLYALSMYGYTISRMYEIIANLMSGMNRRLFQMAITYTLDIEEDNIVHLNPKYGVTKKEIGEHFENLVFQWLKE